MKKLTNHKEIVEYINTYKLKMEGNDYYTINADHFLSILSVPHPRKKFVAAIQLLVEMIQKETRILEGDEILQEIKANEILKLDDNNPNVISQKLTFLRSLGFRDGMWEAYLKVTQLLNDLTQQELEK
jgi:hypothetical protein